MLGDVKSHAIGSVSALEWRPCRDRRMQFARHCSDTNERNFGSLWKLFLLAGEPRCLVGLVVDLLGKCDALAQLRLPPI